MKQGSLLCLLSWRRKKVGRPPGRRRGFAKHRFAPPKPAGCANPAVERDPANGTSNQRQTVGPHQRNVNPPSGIINPPRGNSNPTPGISNPPSGISNPIPRIINPPSGISDPTPGIINPLPGISDPIPGIINPPPGISNPISGIINPRLESVIHSQESSISPPKSVIQFPQPAIRHRRVESSAPMMASTPPGIAMPQCALHVIGPMSGIGGACRQSLGATWSFDSGPRGLRGGPSGSGQVYSAAGAAVGAGRARRWRRNQSMAPSAASSRAPGSRKKSSVPGTLYQSLTHSSRS